MEITTERIDGVLVIGLKGRLDGYAATQAAPEIERSLRDDDRSVVFDLDGLTYMSSAGIRILLALHKKVKARNGGIALCNVGEYPQNVLSMAGFDRVLPIFSSRDDALREVQKREGSLSLIADLKNPAVEREGARFAFEPASRVPASLRVKGSLATLLHARIREEDLSAERLSGITYSLGLGALGSGVEDTMPYLGEMMTLHGSMIWLPTDGHDTPDFFVPAGDTGAVRAYTAFNLSLEGAFNEVAVVEATGEEGIALDALYRAIFALAKERRKECRGVLATAIWGVVAGVQSTGIKRSPIAGSALANGGSILDPENYGEWMDVCTEMKYDGYSIVTFGIGIDRSADLSGYDPAALEAIDAGHAGPSGLSLHNHGVVFRGVPWDPETDLVRGIERCLADGEFVDMRHLLDTTRIRRAKVGIAYISAIKQE